MAGDIVKQLRDTRYPGQMEMRLQAAEIIEQYRCDSERDEAVINRLRAQIQGTKDGRDWHIDNAAEFLAALRQIDTVCADNAGPTCKHDLALKFIRSVVATVTHEPTRLALPSDDHGDAA